MLQHPANVQGQPQPGGPGPQWSAVPYFVGEESLLPPSLPPPTFFNHPIYYYPQQQDPNFAPQGYRYVRYFYEEHHQQQQPLKQQEPPVCLPVPPACETPSPSKNVVKILHRRDSSRKSSFSEKNNNSPSYNPMSHQATPDKYAVNRFHRNSEGDGFNGNYIDHGRTRIFHSSKRH